MTTDPILADFLKQRTEISAQIETLWQGAGSVCQPDTMLKVRALQDQYIAILRAECAYVDWRNAWRRRQAMERAS